MNKGRQRYFYDNRGFILSYRCYSAYVLLTTGPHTRGGQHKVYIRRHVGEPRFYYVRGMGGVAVVIA